MDKTIQIQTQIRQNAEEISSALSEMSKWEKTMKNRDGNIKAAHEKAVRVPRAPIRSGVGTVPVIAKNTIESTKNKDVIQNSDSLWQTPSSIVTSKINNDIKSKAKTESTISVPQALGSYQVRDLEEIERERGNIEFKTGNFTAAVKSYTKCLGLKGKNYVAFSNRAMAYLKLKEYIRAVSDCTCALQIEPCHLKSLLRRASAFNALGKHRAALQDLLLAAQLEPSNKVVRSDTVNTKEQLRSAVNRAPMIPLLPRSTSQRSAECSTSAENGEDAAVLAMQGPDPRPPTYNPPTASSGATEGGCMEVVQADKGEELSSWEVVAAEKGGSTDTTAESCTVVNQPTTSTTATSLTTTSDVAATTKGTSAVGTRVAVVCDDDSSDEEETNRATTTGINTTTPATTTTTAGINTTTAATTTAGINTTTAATTPSKQQPTSTKSANTNTTTSTSKKVRTPSSPSPTTTTTELLPPLRSSYDLERELHHASTDIKLTAQLFKRLKPTHMKKLLSDCLEPNVLYLLLTSVARYYGTYKQKWQKVLLWYTAIKDIKRFSTLYALMSVEYGRELHNILLQVQEHIQNSEYDVDHTNNSSSSTSSSLLAEVEYLLTIY